MKRALLTPLLLAGAAALLVGAGDGPLATPPLLAPGDLDRWFAERDAATATMAVVRLVALVACAWCAVIAAVGALARLAGWWRVAAAADRALPAPVRRLAAGLFGTGLALAVVAPPTAAGASPATASETPAAAPAGIATMTSLPAEAPPAAVPSGGDTWTVAPGESFWSIAAEVLADEWGRPATDDETVPYWRQLIAANEAQLRTGSADLIVPGQVFRLPPPPAPPA